MEYTKNDVSVSEVKNWLRSLYNVLYAGERKRDDKVPLILLLKKSN